MIGSTVQQMAMALVAPLLLPLADVTAAAAAASRQPPEPQSCSLFPGRVLGSHHAFKVMQAQSAAQCCQICSTIVGCEAFNYEALEGKCFFQSDAEPCRGRNCSKPMAVAGLAATGGGVSHSQVKIGHMVHRIDPLFKCWNIDPSENRGWETRNLSRAAPGMMKLYNLAKASLPGYLRFGGGGADSFAYLMPDSPKPYLDCSEVPKSSDSMALVKTRLGKQPPHCLNTTWLLNLLEFAEFAGAHLVFGLDINTRNADTGRWDPTSARALIQYATSHGHSFFGFELGNEQQHRFNASEAAADFLVLQQLLIDLFPNVTKRPRLIGPDISGFKDHFAAEHAEYMLTFANECNRLGIELWALTHHEYIEVPQDSDVPFLVETLDKTAEIAAVVNSTVSPSGIHIWAGEIGPHNGGSPPCSHSSMRWANFADTFWYLDAMATKAKFGYSAFCRQDFIGIDYGMVDCSTNDPLPDYFASVLWSRLVGTAVMDTVCNSSSVRAYAHGHASSKADMTVLMLNLDSVRSNIVSIDVGRVEGGATEEYHLTEGEYKTEVKLNDVTLRATEDGSLPRMTGRQGVASSVRLALASIAFVVLKSDSSKLTSYK